MLDSVVVFCGLLCLCAVIVAYWSLEKFITTKRRLSWAHNVVPAPVPVSATADPVGVPNQVLRPQPPAPPGVSTDGAVRQIAQSVRTLELSHVEALKVLGGRLDELEDDLKKLVQDWESRIEALEKSFAVKVSRQTPEAPKQNIEQPSPPPFV